MPFEHVVAVVGIQFQYFILVACDVGTQGPCPVLGGDDVAREFQFHTAVGHVAHVVGIAGIAH